MANIINAKVISFNSFISFILELVLFLNVVEYFRYFIVDDRDLLIAVSVRETPIRILYELVVLKGVKRRFQ